MHKISNLKPRLKSLIHILYRFMAFRGFFSLIYKLFYISSKPDLQMMTIWKLVKGRLKEPSSFPVLDRLFSQRGWNWFFTDWHSSHHTFSPNNWTKTFHFSHQMSWWTYLSRQHDVLHPCGQKKKEKSSYSFSPCSPLLCTCHSTVKMALDVNDLYM